MVDRAADKYHVCDMEEAWTTVADSRPSIEPWPPRATRPSKILAHTDLFKILPSICCHRISSGDNRRENWYRQYVDRCVIPSPTRLSSVIALAVFIRSICASTGWHLSKNSVTVMEPSRHISAQPWTTADTDCPTRFSIMTMTWREELPGWRGVQLKSKILEGSVPTSILGFFFAIQMPCLTNGALEGTST